jgi:hypothetical protein
VDEARDICCGEGDYEGVLRNTVEILQKKQKM